MTRRKLKQQLFVAGFDCNALKSIAQRLIALSGRPFVRSVMLVASGSAAAQLITMVFSPIITRLYGPEAYGSMGVFMSIASVVSTAAALSYPIAIVLPRSDADALGLARLSIYVGIATSLVVTLVLYLFGLEFIELLNARAIAPFVYLIPVYMLITVMSAVAGQWLIRKKAFALLARVSVWQALLMGLTKAGLGVLHPTAGVLVATNTLGGLIGAVLMTLGWRGGPADDRTKAQVGESKRSAQEIAAQYRDFPLLRTPQVLLNALSHSLPVLMLTTFFGAASVGYYSIASAVLALPAGLIGNSVMQVFYPRITEAINRREDARALIVKATVGLALSGAVPFALLIAAGPILFERVFGAEWHTAGIYAQLLSIWLFFQYINRPAVSAIPALRLQRGLLIYELFSSATKVIALFLGYAIFDSDIAAIALFSIFGAIAYAWLILWVIQCSRRLRIEVATSRY